MFEHIVQAAEYMISKPRPNHLGLMEVLIKAVTFDYVECLKHTVQIAIYVLSNPKLNH
jgi:hypothetical protein